MNPMKEYAIEKLSPGLKDPVLDSQRIFRSILATMSRPGTVTVLGNWPSAPYPLKPAAASVCLALLDMDTHLWTDETTPEMETYLRFHCGCPMTQQAEKADFAIITNGMRLPNLKRFPKGDPEYPDRSATLIIQVQDIEVGVKGVHGPAAGAVCLTGPGIQNEERIRVTGLDESFWPAFADNNAAFPLGFDVILATATEIASLPRTVRAVA